MKTLEERLREQFKRCAQAGFDTDVDEAQAAEDDGVAIVLDALAIVADAPRIYRGEEIRDAPDGLYAFPSLFKPRSVLVWCLDEVVGMMNAEPTAYQWAFGPLPDWLVFDIPTNSPSEGIRATPDLPDSIHRNQGKG